MVTLLVSLGFGSGYLSARFQVQHAPASATLNQLFANWSEEARQQRSVVAEVKEEATRNAAALARRIAQLQAQVMRLNAAGQRLTEIAGLDSGEFDFAQPPGVGGPEVAEAASEPRNDELTAAIDQVDAQLSDRERQFRVLEDLLLSSRIQSEVRPSGWPVETGWISSLFGVRTDPFTGRRTGHRGIDFAAPVGAEVKAVAAGIVTDASVHKGYGKLIEINHGNGYATRYAHNSKLLVQVGDKIDKGQAIALVGSTGRSTGAHVHFEVLFNGLLVNPERYIQAAR
ncbi:M23 family metallopeptidase [Sinimarinibacterium sp. NLF-5-8]|nr:M23 family metallopeptidase [Sinimarinibacterium sp. NLF-5-8]